MLGAILGDIIGSKTEFRPIKTKDFKLFRNGCKFTDDTVMTIATADAILNNKDFTQAYHEWGNKYPNAGYGSMFLSWLDSTDPTPYYSYGNGSAMRISPVGWLKDSKHSVIDIAFRSAEVTHNHPEGIKGAGSVALSILLARQGFSKDSIKITIERMFEYNLSPKLDDIRETYFFNETCQGSVPEAIICFLESNSFEDAIRNAISLGGDSDTQGAIAGSIAEAFYGIPDDIVNQVYNYLPNDMIKIVDQFKEVTRYNS